MLGGSSRPGSTGSQKGARDVKDLSAHVFLCGVLQGSISFENFRKAALHVSLSHISSYVHGRSDKNVRSSSPPKSGSKASWALHWMPQKQASGSKLVAGKMPVWMNVATRLQFARLSSEARDGTVLVDLRDEKSASLAATGDPKSYADAIIAAEMAAATRLQSAPLQQLVAAVEQLIVLDLMFACNLSLSEPVPPAVAQLLERCRELLKMKRVADDLKLFAKAATLACTAAMERVNGALQQAVHTLDRAILLLASAEEGSSGLTCVCPFMVNKATLLLQLGRFDPAVDTIRAAVSNLMACIKAAVLREDAAMLHANALELGVAYFNLGLAHDLARQTSLAFESWREGECTGTDVCVLDPTTSAGARVSLTYFSNAFPLSQLLLQSHAQLVDGCEMSREARSAEISAMKAVVLAALQESKSPPFSRLFLRTPPWQSSQLNSSVLPAVSLAGLRDAKRTKRDEEEVSRKLENDIMQAKAEHDREASMLVEVLPVMNLLFSAYSMSGQSVLGAGGRSKTLDLNEFTQMLYDFKICDAAVSKTAAVEEWKSVFRSSTLYKLQMKQRGKATSQTMEADFKYFVDIMKSIARRLHHSNLDGRVDQTDEENDNGLRIEGPSDPWLEFESQFYLNCFDMCRSSMEAQGVLPSGNKLGARLDAHYNHLRELALLVYGEEATSFSLPSAEEEDDGAPKKKKAPLIPRVASLDHRAAQADTSKIEKMKSDAAKLEKPKQVKATLQARPARVLPVKLPAVSPARTAAVDGDLQESVQVDADVANCVEDQQDAGDDEYGQGEFEEEVKPDAAGGGLLRRVVSGLDQEADADSDDLGSMSSSRPSTRDGKDSFLRRSEGAKDKSTVWLLARVEELEGLLIKLQQKLDFDKNMRRQSEKQLVQMRQQTTLKVGAVMFAKMMARSMTTFLSKWQQYVKVRKEHKLRVRRNLGKFFHKTKGRSFHGWHAVAIDVQLAQSAVSSILSDLVDRVLNPHDKVVVLMCSGVFDSVFDAAMVIVDANFERLELLECMRNAVADVQQRTLLERSGLVHEHEQTLEKERELERQRAQRQMDHMSNLLECHIIFESRVYARFLMHLQEQQEREHSLAVNELLQQQLHIKLQADMHVASSIEEQQLMKQQMDEFASLQLQKKSAHYKNVMEKLLLKFDRRIIRLSFFSIKHRYDKKIRLKNVMGMRIVKKVSSNLLARFFAILVEHTVQNKSARKFCSLMVEMAVLQVCNYIDVEEVKLEALMKLDSLKQRRIQNLMSSMSAKNERQALAETFGEWKIVKQQEKEIRHKARRLMSRFVQGGTMRSFMQWAGFCSHLRNMRASVSSVIDVVLFNVEYELDVKSMQQQRHREAMSLQNELARLVETQKEEKKVSMQSALSGISSDEAVMRIVRSKYKRVLRHMIDRLNRAWRVTIIRRWRYRAHHSAHLLQLQLHAHQRRLVGVGSKVLVHWSNAVHKEQHGKHLTDKAKAVQTLMSVVATLDRDMKLLQSTAMHRISASSAKLQLLNTFCFQLQGRVRLLQLSDASHLSAADALREDVVALETKLGYEVRKRQQLERQNKEMAATCSEFDMMSEEIQVLAPSLLRFAACLARDFAVQAERRDMERQFESAKFDLARKLLVEKVRRTRDTGCGSGRSHRAQEELKARMDRDREVLAKRLDGERASREELQGELSKLRRQTQALENVEEMLFKERAQRQRAERSIVELARSLGTLKAALLHAGLPVPPDARPSSALQLTVQVRRPQQQLWSARLALRLFPTHSASNFQLLHLRKRGNVLQEFNFNIRLRRP